MPRDGPRAKKKQGWECPAPTVEDWEDYKKLGQPAPGNLKGTIKEFLKNS